MALGLAGALPDASAQTPSRAESFDITAFVTSQTGEPIVIDLSIMDRVSNVVDTVTIRVTSVSTQSTGGIGSTARITGDLQIEYDSGTLTGGVDEIYYGVTDSNGITSNGTITVITRPVINTQRQPLIDGTGPYEGMEFTRNMMVDIEYPSHEDYTFMITGDARGATIGPGNVFTWTPREEHGSEGGIEHEFNITATNTAMTNTLTGVFPIEIGETNQPPTVVLPLVGEDSSAGPYTAYVGQIFRLQVNGTDPDLPPQMIVFDGFGNAVREPVVGLPAGASYEGGVITWTPTTTGTTSLDVIVEDDYDLNFDHQEGPGEAPPLPFMINSVDPVIRVEPELTFESGQHFVGFTVTSLQSEGINIIGRVLDPDRNVISDLESTALPAMGDLPNPYQPLPPLTKGTTYTYEFALSDDPEYIEAIARQMFTVPNEKPTASDESRTIPEDSGTITIAPTLMDPDGDDNAVTITATEGASRGTAAIVGDTITYTPIPDAHGTDTINYTIADEDGTLGTGTITITITPVNDPPVLTVPTFGPVGQGEVFAITFGATDIDDSNLTFEITGAPEGATIDEQTGELRWPDIPKNIGSYTFSVAVSDDDGASDSQEITITVTRQSVAVDDEATSNGIENLIIDVAENDELAGAFIEGLTVAPLSGPTTGLNVFAGGNMVIYRPSPEDRLFPNGTMVVYTYTLTLSVIDAMSNTRTETITANVTITFEFEDRLEAIDDVTATGQNEQVSINVLDNDIYSESLPTVAIVSGPSSGMITLSGSTFTYTPNTGYTGADTFVYNITDADDNSDEATVTIEVNLPPVAVDDEVTSNKVDTLHIHATANDMPTTAFIAVVNAPDSILTDTVTFNDTHIIYDPSAEAASIPDGTQIVLSYFLFTLGPFPPSEADVTITFQSEVELDAVDDQASTTTNTPVEINVLDNDIYDTDGPPVIPQVTTQPEHGTVELTADLGILRYTPETDYTGQDSFVYSITDSESTDSDTATVTITVEEIQPVVTATPTVRFNTSPPGAVNAYLVDTRVTPHFTGLLLGRILTSENVLFSTYTDRNVMDGQAYTQGSFTGLQPLTTYFIEFARSDDPNYQGADVVRIEFTTPALPNQPPDAPDEPHTTPEDTAITITPAIMDDMDDGTITAVTNGTLGTATTNGTTITYTPNDDVNGTDTIEYTVTDGGGATDTGTITITITPVNDAPVLTVPTIGPVSEMTEFTTTLEATDADNATAELTFGVQNAPDGLEVSGDQLTWNATEAQGSQTFTFTITVTDGIAMDSQEVTVTVTETNQNPEFAFVPQADLLPEAMVGVEFNAIFVIAEDADTPAQTLSFDVSSNATGNQTIGMVDPTDSGVYNVDWTPTVAETVSITVTVSDGQTPEGTAEVTFVVEVQHTMPTAPDETATTLEDMAVTITPDIMGSDPDLEITQVTDGARGTAITNGTAITYTPNEDQNGEDMITYTVVNSDGTSPMMGTITITITPVNDAPVLGAIDDITVDEGDPVEIRPTATDVDNNDATLTFSLGGEALPTAAIFNPANGHLDWTTTESDGGDSYMITITASDGQLDSNSEDVTITVTETNQDPVLNIILNASVRAGDTITFMATANDGDIPVQSLTYSITNAPAGATIGANDGVFSWTPTITDDGDYIINVTVSDGAGGSDSQNVTITVTDQDPPTAPNEPHTVDEDSGANTITPDIMDDDPNPIIIEVTNGTKGIASHTDTTITYTPNADENGDDMITYTVRDADGAEVDGTITITITPVNDAPALEPIADITADEGQTVRVRPAASDADTGDTLTFSLERGTLPAAATFTETNGHLDWTTTEQDGGTSHEINITVSDGNGGSDSETFTITVTETNQDPVFDIVTEHRTLVGAPFTLDVTATDDDTPVQTITYGITSDATGAEPAIDPTTGTITWTPNMTQTASITVTASDNHTTPGTEDITITVTVAEIVANNDEDTSNVVDTLAIDVITNDAPADVRIAELNLEQLVTDYPDRTITSTINGIPTTVTTFDISHNGTHIIYEPSPGERDIPDGSTLTFGYTLESPDGTMQDQASVTITLMADDRIQAVDDIAATAQNTTVGINVLANDIYDTSNPPTPTVRTNPSDGTVEDWNGTAFTYTPDEDFTGTDTFVYNITDTVEATVTIEVNEPPVAVNDTATSNGIDTLVIDVTANDTPDNAFIAGLDSGSLYTDFDNFGALIHNDTHIIYEPSDTDALITNGTQIVIRYTLAVAGVAELAEANVTITFQADPIEAVDDFTSTLPDTPVDIDVLANDIYNRNGPPMMPTVVDPPENGTVVLTDDLGILRYTPDTGYIGTDTFVYEINDIVNDIDYNATVTITVGLVAPDESYTILEDSGDLTITPAISDSNGTATIRTIAQGTLGFALFNETTITYTPNDDAHGTDTITYVVVNDADDTDMGTITITITPVNDAPVFGDIMADQSATVNELFTLDVTATDVDGPEQTLSYNMTHNATGAEPAINPNNGTITWTPDTIEIVSIAVSVSDDQTPAGTDDITITVTVTSERVTNTPPVADDFGISVTRSGTVTVNLVDEGHISDAEQAGDTLAVSLDATNATQGQPDIQGVIFTYTANDNAIGTDTLSYTVTDAGDLTDSGTITVTISTLEVLDIDIVTQPGELEIIRLDLDEGITITNATGAEQGTIDVLLALDQILYMSNANASGLDTITYTVTDGTGNTGQGTIYLHINEAGNVAPTLDDIPLSIAQPQDQLNVQIMADDNETITYDVRNAPEGVEISEEGQLSWDTSEADAGDYIFTVVAYDERGGFNSQDIAIIVSSNDTANRNPTAPDVQVAIGADGSTAIIPDIRDQDGDDIYIIAASGQTKGQIVQDLLQFGILAYEPDPNQAGIDEISYTVSDRVGGWMAGTISVHIEDPANRSPSLEAIGSIQLEVPGNATFQALATDPDDDVLTYVITDAPEDATIDGATGAFSWAVNETGDYSFTVTVYDDRGGFDTEPVTIVAGEPDSANRDPIAPDLDTAARQDSARVIRLSLSDPDGTTPDIVLATGTTLGTVIPESLQFGFILYEPDAGVSGLDSITYYISDGAGGLASGTVYVHIRETDNNLPVLEPIGIQQVDVQNELTFTANGSDVDGDTLTYAIRNAPANAAIDSATGVFTWTPGTNDTGDYEFTVTVYDDAGTFASESIIVTVTNPNSGNQNPVAPDTSSTATPDVTTPILPLISDPDGGTARIIAVSGLDQGTIVAESLEEGIIAYRSFEGASGVDTITYTVSDGQGGLATGTITITITNATATAPAS